MPNVYPFWKSESPFSNWWIKTLPGKNYQFEENGVKYLCTEQYMMAKKALLFKDSVSHDLIMKATTPKEHKKLGKLVRNFDQTIWDQTCRRIVYDGLLAKFSQHPEARKALLDTKDAIICEASPYDRIWGVGLRPTNPDAKNPKKWKGTNFLGYELMNVRNTLTSES